MEIKDQVIVTFVGIAFSLFLVDQLIEPAPKKVGSHMKTVATRVAATTPTKVAAATPKAAEVQHVKAMTVVATTADASPTFFQEGLTRVDTHTYGATAFYFVVEPQKTDLEAVAVAATDVTFFQSGLVRVDQHANGATAFYE